MGATARYKLFVGWCGTNGERSMSQTEFGLRLPKLGFKKDAKSGRVVYYGIGLRVKID